VAATRVVLADRVSVRDSNSLLEPLTRIRLVPTFRDMSPDRAPEVRFVPLGLELDGDGAHPAAWRHAHHDPADLLAPTRLAATARTAEQGGFSFLTLASDRAGDGYPNVQARLEPLELAAYLAAVTTRIGLVPETKAAGAEPFHLANRLASLDWAAQGRAGWAVTPSEAADVAEVVDAVRALWDTWEDGVFLADEATGRFLDLDRWHYADFVGRTFTVKGPSVTPRPPQGHLPVLGALPGVVDVVRVGGSDLDDALSNAATARASGAAVLLDVEVLLDADASAAEREASLDRWAPWPPTAALRFAGSAADLLAALRAASGHVDAIRLDPAVLDVDLPVLARQVVPALAPPSGGRLRDLLGLPPAGNRFTERRARTLENGDAA
jgi:alkanesulfonate monooxygenase SsuD/methylene tetrahydromethanopterin reductase-like flavin-dependent oxidoreductase (luciferase family)